MCCSKFFRYFSGLVLALGFLPALAIDDPFSLQSENQPVQDLESHRGKILEITVVGIMGIQGHLVAVLKTTQGHFHIVSNGDLLEKEDIEIVELGWQRILARHNGRIHQLNIPRTSFKWLPGNAPIP